MKIDGTLSRLFCRAAAMALLLSLPYPGSGFALAQTTTMKLWQQAQNAQNSGHYAQAEQLWQKVLAQDPASAEAYYNLGLSLHRQYKFPAAIVAYQNAIRLNPEYDFAYINLGLALIQVGKMEEAIHPLQVVTSLPNHASQPAGTQTLAHYNLAIIFKRQNKLQAALQEVQQALALTPDFKPGQELLQQLQNGTPPP